jgi:hypothetical protein
MWTAGVQLYNGRVTANDTSRSAPHFAVAGVILDALAARDFAGIAAALDVDAQMTALVPKGLRQCDGADAICSMFETWFGDVDEYAVADASVGAVGELLQMRWRLELEGPRLGEEPMVVEQHAYAATGPNGRVTRISLLCSGFWPEPRDSVRPNATERSRDLDDEATRPNPNAAERN